MVIALCIFAIVCLALAQHSFVTYPAGLFLYGWITGKNRLETPQLDVFPPLSILCCCHNEEIVIADKVENGLAAAANYPGEVEFLFYLDNCTDRTREILERYEGKVRVVLSDGHTGKSVGMRELSRWAEHDILVFTDANTYLAPDALVEAAKGLADKAIGGVTGVLHCTNHNESEIARVNTLYWQLEELIKRVESATGTTMGADGAFFAIRRELYVPTPPDIIDDMHTSMAVVLAGHRFVSLPTVKTFEKTSTKSADEFRRKVRITCRAFNCYRHIKTKLHACDADVVYRFYSHKVLRWLSLPLAICGLTFGAVAILLANHLGIVFVVAGLTCGGALLGRLGVRPFSALNEMMISLSAVAVGVLESLRGKRYQKWTIASSGR